jgi:hypothetical protein
VDWHGWKPVAARYIEHLRTEPARVGLEELIEVLAEAVIAVELVEKLEDGARAKPMKCPDVPLPP